MLAPIDVTVIVVENARLNSRYAFPCPMCKRVISKFIDLNMIRLLTSAGCQLQRERWPEEVFDKRMSTPLYRQEADDFFIDLYTTDLLALRIAAEYPESFTTAEN